MNLSSAIQHVNRAMSELREKQTEAEGQGKVTLAKKLDRQNESLYRVLNTLHTIQAKQKDA